MILPPKRWPGLLSACLAVGPLFAVANGPVKTASASEAQDKAKEEITAEKLEALCQKLNAKAYTDREEASHQLFQAGKPAVEHLAKTAQGKSREASTRALNVLKQLYESGKDNTTKAAAEAALTKLAGSNSPWLARRANEALGAAPETKKGPVTPAQPNPEPPLTPEQQELKKILQNEVRQALKNGVKLPTAPTPEPVQKAEVKDGNKKILILKREKGITVKVTETIKGKRKEQDTEKVTEYQAESLSELKKQHREAFKLYKKYKKKLVETVEKPKQE